MAKIIINGNEVESGTNVEMMLNGQKVTLTTSTLSDLELKNADVKTWEAGHGVTCKFYNVGTKKYNDVYVGDKLIFSNMTAQAVFTLMLAQFGQDVNTTNRLYKKGIGRKDGVSTRKAKVVVTDNSNGVWK